MMGVDVQSRWLDLPDGANPFPGQKQGSREATKDLDDIEVCDALVLDDMGEGGRGRYWEAGYAQRCEIPVYVVAPSVQHPFYTQARAIFTSWQDFFNRQGEWWDGE
jgi:nucleoside 2-deoxyribosyltransferase